MQTTISNEINILHKQIQELTHEVMSLREQLAKKGVTIKKKIV